MATTSYDKISYTILDNLVVDSIIGVGITDLGDWTSTTEGWIYFEVGDPAELETDTVRSGLYSIKVPVNGSGEASPVYQFIDYVPNRTYQTTLWLYGDGSSSVRILDDDTALGGLDETVTPPAEWTKYTFEFTANAYSDVIRIIRRYPSEVSWAFYIDDVAIENIGYAGLSADTNVYAGLGIMCDNNDIYCDTLEYYCDGAVAMWDIEHASTRYSSIYGVAGPEEVLLMEDGSELLLEDGDFLELEDG